jgi:predicted nucleotidyltransferase
MTNSSLDFSQRGELSLHANVVADVEAAAASVGTQAVIVGAFARDLHLLYRHGIATQRETKDVDIALAMPDWKTFETCLSVTSRPLNVGSHGRRVATL